MAYHTTLGPAEEVFSLLSDYFVHFQDTISIHHGSSPLVNLCPGKRSHEKGTQKQASDFTPFFLQSNPRNTPRVLCLYRQVLEKAISAFGMIPLMGPGMGPLPPVSCPSFLNPPLFPQIYDGCNTGTHVGNAFRTFFPEANAD